jgi:hypothetical protein
MTAKSSPVTTVERKPELREQIKQLQEKEEGFYNEAFTNPVTKKPYDIPVNLRRVATRISRSYGIRGICDPMYIANIIAFELGLGDGQSHFNSIS